MQIDDVSILEYVEKQGLLPGGQKLGVEAAGDGNINYVRRVQAANGSSLIVKHARPTLERFPEYQAPPDRLHFEHAYGEAVRSLIEEEDVLPRVLHFDRAASILVLEDLGNVPRLEETLLSGEAPADALGKLGDFLGRVHTATRPAAERLAPLFRNDEMRRLHGEHIFHLPFEPNDFPLPEEVRKEADRLLDSNVRDHIRALRERYYDSREALVHGDVQPTNILLSASGPKLLDAEIAHVGDPAFDVGTLVGHLRIHWAARQERGATPWEPAFLRGYLGSGAGREETRRALDYAAVEMLRRTIGAARVRAVEEPAAAIAVLRCAVEMLRA
jgi:5-methylthioribose kinase